MSDTVPTPTAPTPAPAVPAVATPTRGPAPLPSTAELLSQVAAAKPASGTTAGSTGQVSENGAASTAEGSPTADASKPADDVTLARVAREQRKLDADRKALKEEQGKLHGAAADAEAYRKLQTLKGTSKLEAIKALIGEGAIEETYWELNQHILDNAKPVSDDDKITARVKREVAAAKAADEEARKADEGKASREHAAAVEVAEGKYVDTAAELYAADPSKFPGLSQFPVDGRDILGFAEKHFTDKGTLPTAAEVLTHFENDRQARLDALRPAAKSAGTTTVTGQWRNDSTLKSLKEQSLKDIHEEALREAQIIR